MEARLEDYPVEVMEAHLEEDCLEEDCLEARQGLQTELPLEEDPLVGDGTVDELEAQSEVQLVAPLEG
jgi:hypothetical protein